jgi:nonsense-mediated mRNA decay protein 3
MVEVEIARACDYGVNDQTFVVNTHLGAVLNFNDTVLGFDLDAININELEELQNSAANGGKKITAKMIPDVVLVRKTYPKYRKKQKSRPWKLKHLIKEAEDENNIHTTKKK